MISEIFSTSFLFSIAIIIIAVGGLFAYFNYRLSEHNHKMQAMMGLVSTMAEEMQYFRSKIHNSPDDSNINNTHVVPNFLGGAIKEDDLIEVSDSDASSEDEDDDDSNSVASSVASSEADDDDSNSVASSEDDELDELEDLDNLDELDDLEVDDLEADDSSIKKIITIDLGAGNDMPIESENIEETEPDKNDSIDLNLSNLEEDLDLDISLKTISIDTTISTNKEKEDYKKMSLNKLRELVCEKGLVKDSSKLKKNELLKMLGAE